MSTVLASVASRYAQAHEQVLNLVADLTDEQLRRSPGQSSPPIAFHLWHMARYADSLPQEMLAPTKSAQIWEVEGLAAKWGLDPSSLGLYQTGTRMDIDVALNLAWPNKDALVDYAGRSFAAAERAVATLDDSRFGYPAMSWSGRTIGWIVLEYLTNDQRHMGMIECLKGVLGLEGSARG